MNLPLFYLGTHHPHWLALVDVPLFVSRRSLARYKTLPRARRPWALDSGGFSELSLHGAWTLSPADYAREVLRYQDEIGALAWAAPQDWMCEPVMLTRTGLTVDEHQARTVASVLDLRARGVPAIPVLQGWSLGDYFRCVDLYDKAGINLRAEPIVGLGSVCRRQNTTLASLLVHQLTHEGMRLHGFGFKATGLRASVHDLASADSLAWSYHARREPPRDECRGTHKNCANCLAFALEWRADLIDRMTREAHRAAQGSLRGIA